MSNKEIKQEIVPDEDAVIAARKKHEEHHKNLPVPAANEKPMNATQMKNLQAIVAGDFDDLKAAVRADIDKRLGARLRYISETYDSPESINAAWLKIRELTAELHERVGELEASLREGGFTWSGMLINVASTSQLNLSEGVNLKQRANQAAERLRAAAFRVIDKEKRKIDRTILLQGITGMAAQTILDDMPEAEDIVRLVIAELQDSADLEELAV